MKIGIDVNQTTIIFVAISKINENIIRPIPIIVTLEDFIPLYLFLNGRLRISIPTSRYMVEIRTNSESIMVKLFDRKFNDKRMSVIFKTYKDAVVKTFLSL